MLHKSQESPTPQNLPPPFSPDQSIASLEGCLANLPAAVVGRGRVLRPARDLRLYLQSQLEPWRINRIDKYLWFARDRLPQARSLHRHVVRRRQIVLTESPSEHLISDYSVVFIKPLPEYLLSYDFWERHLCRDTALYADARGLLLSYTWLVAYKTDFDMAIEMRLLPAAVTWPAWISLVAGFLDRLHHLDASQQPRLIGKRYRFGELRMSRVNYIYKFIPSLWLSSDNPLRGFMPTSMWNGSFRDRNIARLLVVFVFFSLALSAMQVGLATSPLGEQSTFMGAAYGFAVASLFAVALCTVAALVALAWHVRYKIILPWYIGPTEIRGVYEIP
ncbi:hypothetical protein B0T18DRAFT_414354 [Schizothecium vesticola]|uniref:Uncharacterized protein n=1 Tax=Schizothecium vesticola TaxID=314040 RepID=A0AA40EPF3_9PEZI|nr:hypothetical protein B0T18DRAFT_414354 [Schizothecium vesticola]